MPPPPYIQKLPHQCKYKLEYIDKMGMHGLTSRTDVAKSMNSIDMSYQLYQSGLLGPHLGN